MRNKHAIQSIRDEEGEEVELKLREREIAAICYILGRVCEPLARKALEKGGIDKMSEQEGQLLAATYDVADAQEKLAPIGRNFISRQVRKIKLAGG